MFDVEYAKKDIDVTFPDQPPILQAIVLHRYLIQPEQIGDHKLALHHEYLHHWIKENELDKRYSFGQVWRLRGAWIASL